MKNTVIEIEYKKYTENIIVDSYEKEQEFNEIKKTKDFVSYKVVFQGDYELTIDVISELRKAQKEYKKEYGSDCLNYLSKELKKILEDSFDPYDIKSSKKGIVKDNIRGGLSDDWGYILDYITFDVFFGAVIWSILDQKTITEKGLRAYGFTI